MAGNQDIPDWARDDEEATAARAKPWSALTISRSALPAPRAQSAAPNPFDEFDTPKANDGWEDFHPQPAPSQAQGVPDWAKDEWEDFHPQPAPRGANPFDEFDDLSKLSDAELLRRHNAAKAQSAGGLSAMSDADLLKAYAAARGDGWHDVPTLDADALQTMRREKAANGDASAAADYISNGGDTRDVLTRDLRQNARVQGRVLLNDIKRIPGETWGAIKGAGHAAVDLGARAVHDLNNPNDALDDLSAAGGKMVDTAKNAALHPIDTIRAFNKTIDDPSRPVSSLLNAVTMATGGEGTLGRGALRGTTELGGLADRAIIRPANSLVSGVSSNAQRLAQEAGEQGGAVGRAFRANMAEPDYAEMRRTGQAGVRGLKQERGNEYVAGMQAVANSNARVPYANTLQAAQDGRAMGLGRNGAFVKDPAVIEAMNDVDRAIAEHRVIPGAPAIRATRRSPLEMDELKQRLGRVLGGLPEGSPAHAAVSGVYNALRNDIVGAVPEYANVMATYGTASDALKDALQSLGLNNRVTRSSTANRLMAALRDQGSVAQGSREVALNDVARFAPTLPYQIAGATMNPVLPRGIVGRGVAALRSREALGAEGVGAVLGHAHLPAAALALAKALPFLATQSPRVIGNVRYGIGATTRGARALGLTQRNLGLAADAGRLASIWDPPDSE